MFRTWSAWHGQDASLEQRGWRELGRVQEGGLDGVALEEAGHWGSLSSGDSRRFRPRGLRHVCCSHVCDQRAVPGDPVNLTLKKMAEPVQLRVTVTAPNVSS